MQKFPSSLMQVAEEKIKNLIINGKLQLGQRVTEADLSTLFGMSKTPVHEALQHLQRMGLVEIIARQGTYIFNFSSEEIANLNNARYVIECEAVREAVDKNNDRLCIELGKNLERAAKAMSLQNIQQYISIDKEFHSYFFTFSHNKFLISAFSSIEAKVFTLWNLTMRNNYTLEDMSISIQQHEAIAESILDNNIDTACAILKTHIFRAEQHYVKNCMAETAPKE